MRPSTKAISFHERHLATDSGFSLIWLFINVPRGPGPYELLLDNNAATETGWINQLPPEFRRVMTINLWPALMEQWISNPEFRVNPVQRIKDDYLKPLIAAGLQFDNNFAQKQVNLLLSAQEHIKSHLSLLFPNIAIAKLLTRLKPKEDALPRLREIAHNNNIPRFSGCVVLTALTLVLRDRGNQKLTLNEASKPAYSFLDGFFANQPGRKNEPAYHMDIAYLRNRAGDLTLWYSPSHLLQLGYRPVGELVLVTRDKALRKIIPPMIPPCQDESRTVAFALDPMALPENLSRSIHAVLLQRPISPPTTVEEKVKKMEALYKRATSLSKDQREHETLDKVWAEWCQPCRHPARAQEMHPWRGDPHSSNYLCAAFNDPSLFLSGSVSKQPSR